MAHTVEIKEIINGVQITETLDGNVVEKLISYQAKPFLRTTNETGEETYQIIDKVGEIYNIPALATSFRIIDANDAVFIPANGVELIEYSLKLRLFRPDAEDDEFYIGNIATTANSLTMNLPVEGVNWAKIGGNFYEKYYPDTFNFTPVTTGEKILIIHALPDAQVFHLAQGIESTEAVEPSYSGLFVARILVSSEGQDITEAISGYREKIIDSWNGVYIPSGDNILIISNYGLRYSLFGNTGVRIGGFYNYRTEPLYNGIPLSIKNDTGDDIEFFNLSDSSPNFIPINPADLPFSIKNGETANFAWNPANGYEIIKTGSTPNLSGYATTPQLDAEITERALQANNINLARIQGDNNLQGQITDLSIHQIEITTATSITTNSVGTGTDAGIAQHMRSVLVKNGVNAINITLETSSHAKFAAIYYKKGSAAITFVAGAGVPAPISPDGLILNGAENSCALVYRDGNVFNVLISNR